MHAVSTAPICRPHPQPEAPPTEQAVAPTYHLLTGLLAIHEALGNGIWGEDLIAATGGDRDGKRATRHERPYEQGLVEIGNANHTTGTFLECCFF